MKILVLCGLVTSVLSLTARQTAQSQTAKVYPGDKAYPTIEQWNAFNTSLGGKLIKYVNPGEACYRNNFNLKACANHNWNFFDATYVRNDPGLVNWPQWAGSPCSTTIQTLADLSRPQLLATNCTHGRYPDYVVAAKDAKDVAAAVKFAGEKKLRLIVKNTGHDFLGRNTGFGSLSIWTRNIGGIRWIDKWTGPPPAPDMSGQWQGAAIRYGSGFRWEDINAAVHEHNHTIVTGGEPTVGAGGGWIQGGGHGPYSNFYGMGAEQVLEFEVVTPTGEVVTANAKSHPDLFFALRGGGGSTFGVVTQITYKAYPTPPVSLMALTFGVTDLSQEQQDKFYDALAHFLAKNPEMNDFGLTGHPIVIKKGYIAVLMAPNKTKEEVEKFWKPHHKALSDMGVFAQYHVFGPEVNQAAENHKLYLSYMGYMGSLQSEPAGIPIVYGSRLLSREALTKPDTAPIRQMLVKILEEPNALVLPFNCVPGKRHADRPWNIGLNPAWKDAAIHFSADSYGGYQLSNVTLSSMLGLNIPSWSLPGLSRRDAAPEKSMREKYKVVHERFIPALDPLSQNHAAYFNEASPFEDDWKTTFFGGGDHYQKLLDVKKKYDPQNVLWCMPCVNGDALVEGSDGKLYLP